VTFYGVRGSCPCPSPSTRRYGGNTPCVTVQAAGESPIILDLGTGVRELGRLASLATMDAPFRATALVSHVHLDHIQGLPFFSPLSRPGTMLDIYGPPDGGRSLAEVLDGIVGPPYFPVHLADLPASVRCTDALDTVLAVGNARVVVAPIPHTGPTVGYRIEWHGVTVAYVTDHQAPLDHDSVDERVLELADGADLLVHDAQYTSEEFALRSTWGHGTPHYAVRVAALAGAKRLALFHHDPAHDDDDLDRLLAEAQDGAPAGLEVISAREGLCVRL
jgi:phosphoribosyl 1,2-cyclic phosphodiesterase